MRQKDVAVVTIILRHGVVFMYLYLVFADRSAPRTKRNNIDFPPEMEIYGPRKQVFGVFAHTSRDALWFLELQLLVRLRCVIALRMIGEFWVCDRNLSRFEE